MAGERDVGASSGTTPGSAGTLGSLLVWEKDQVPFLYFHMPVTLKRTVQYWQQVTVACYLFNVFVGVADFVLIKNNLILGGDYV